MIHYQLQCSREHGFDGWFKDSAAFDVQAQRGLLQCPVCGDREVRRGLMAPALPRKSNAVRPQPATETTSPPAQLPAVQEANKPVVVAADRLPDQVRAALQRVRAEVEKTCDYVGTEFADEARRMHRGESERRGIYGETTPDQAEALADEGIEVSRIPWVPRADG
jgi:hypothetical protein